MTEKGFPSAPPTPTPRQPAPPGPEDAEIYVEFSQTSQKEMYLPGHGPRRSIYPGEIRTEENQRNTRKRGCRIYCSSTTTVSF